MFRSSVNVMPLSGHCRSTVCCTTRDNSAVITKNVCYRRSLVIMVIIILVPSVILDVLW